MISRCDAAVVQPHLAWRAPYRGLGLPLRGSKAKRSRSASMLWPVNAGCHKAVALRGVLHAVFSNFFEMGHNVKQVIRI